MPQDRFSFFRWQQKDGQSSVVNFLQLNPLDLAKKG